MIYRFQNKDNTYVVLEANGHPNHLLERTSTIPELPATRSLPPPNFWLSRSAPFWHSVQLHSGVLTGDGFPCDGLHHVSFTPTGSSHSHTVPTGSGHSQLMFVAR